MRYVVVIIVIAILAFGFFGSGKSDDPGHDRIGHDSGATAIETPQPTTDTGGPVAQNPFQNSVPKNQPRADAKSYTAPNPFQQTAPTQNVEASTPVTEKAAATSDRDNALAGTPQESTVTGVEKVTGPHGPFPTGPGAATEDNAHMQEPPVDPIPPAEVPETPRGPFGPFSTSH